MDTKLPIEFKTKWIEALRSGKYPQAKHHLKCSGGFCCLGVAAEIAGAEWDYATTQGVYCTLNGSTTALQSGDVPEDVLSALLQGSDPETHHDFETILIAMNDEGQSFADIADWIEVNL